MSKRSNNDMLIKMTFCFICNKKIKWYQRRESVFTISKEQYELWNKKAIYPAPKIKKEERHSNCKTIVLTFPTLIDVEIS
jgi:hypothetical protein